MAIIVRNHSRVGVGTSDEPSSTTVQFECLREVTARPSPTSVIANQNLQERLSECRVRCQKGSTKSAQQCLDCPFLVNVLPQGERNLLIRCLHQESDPVESVMTLASSLETVAPATRVSKAVFTAGIRGLRHLLVVNSSGVLEGIVRCYDLANSNSDDTIASITNRCPWVVDRTATLGAAIELMAEKGIGLVPVVDGKTLLGVLTRGDLLRIGIEKSILSQLS